MNAEMLNSYTQGDRRGHYRLVYNNANLPCGIFFDHGGHNRMFFSMIQHPHCFSNNQVCEECLRNINRACNLIVAWHMGVALTNPAPRGPVMHHQSVEPRGPTQ